ncbi:hypothetical protein SELMODRAFT_421620 [Selaginella moellendorffii]|uniref:Uncharacterized protein n=1 Tax=Selaginella moellendorffii TaxID=88036 RepID=D8SFU4_SELML|nr:hypothetical protein SELMODRAFT_421620 [Selaginella moellendorffii]
MEVTIDLQMDEGRSGGGCGSLRDNGTRLSAAAGDDGFHNLHFEEAGFESESRRLKWRFLATHTHCARAEQQALAAPPRYGSFDAIIWMFLVVALDERSHRLISLDGRKVWVALRPQPWKFGLLLSKLCLDCFEKEFPSSFSRHDFCPENYGEIARSDEKSWSHGLS